MNKERIDIIIISYNTSILTLKCVESICNSSSGHLPVSITVVDNASIDNTLQALNVNYPDVNVIENSKNLGYAAAINIGMRSTASEFVIISNTDVEFHVGSINTLIEFLYSHPDVGAVGPQQVYPDGSWQRSYGSVPGIEEGVKDLFGITSLTHAMKHFSWPRSRGKSQAKSVGYIDGAVLAFRRDAYGSVGGFDEDFFFFAEEADFCFRLRNAGWKIMSVPAAHVTHLRGASSKKGKVVNHKRLKLLIDSKVLFASKHYSIRHVYLYILLEKLHAVKMQLLYLLIGYLIPKNKKCHQINTKAAIFERLKEIWAEKQKFLSKVDQESRSNFIWFDPVNNDPHFIQLMSSILESNGLYFDALATLRSNFQWTGKGRFIKFMPSSISLRIASGGKAIRLIVGLIYIPSLIRALVILAFRAKAVLISSGLWFPNLDTIVLKCLKYLGIPFHVLVHRPYRIGKKITKGMKAFFNPQYSYIALSDFSKQLLITNYNVRENNIRVLRHPNFNIEYNKIVPIRVIKEHLIEWKKGRSLFLYMSGVTIEHGILDFVTVIKSCFGGYPYCFLICGNPQNSEQIEISLKIKSEFSETEAVKYNFGFYSNEEAKTWLSVADALVLPYREIVQSGVQALSLGQGVPVIVRDVGGLSEEVVNGWNGIILRENSTEECLKALASVHSGLADKQEIIEYSERNNGCKITAEFFKGLLDI